MSTKRLVTMLLPLVAIYAVLLVNSYSPDTLSLVLPGSLKDGLSGGFNPQFVPKLANISTLFSRVGVASSLWVHFARRQRVLCRVVDAARARRGHSRVSYHRLEYGVWADRVAQ